MSKVKLGLILLLWICFNLIGGVAAMPPGQGSSNQQLIDQLKQNTQNKVRISYHPDTGQVNFIGTELANPIIQPGRLAANASPEAMARGFLAKYGQLFGLKDQSGELRLTKEQIQPDGRSFGRFQQLYKGIPIVAGEMIVQADAKRNVISANGEILPNLDLGTTPTVTAEAARQTALAKTAKDHQVSEVNLTASAPELWIYNPVLLDAPGPRRSSLVWRIEVTPLKLLPIREFVLIDAQRGGVTLNFNQVDTARNRNTYTANNGTSLPGTLVCNEANPTCSGGDAHAVAAHRYASHTYDFYLSNHGRDSINNAGMTLISTVHYGVNFVNAFWNGTQMVYGDGAGFPLADDVVGHELTHGVTELESGLFYFYQSGAINESFSDVWGEFVDLTNGFGNDSAGVRWQMGEDVSGLGALRNMQNPPAFGDPDRMLSANYYCGEDDGGGVHFNSGVNNKAAYLMTDGGTFNGQTVTGLGIAKVADLYYQVQTQLLTSGSNYLDLYNALIQAGANLGYTSTERQEILDALTAVQMNQRPCSDPPQATICPSDQTPANLFFDDFEGGFSNWLTSGAPIWGPGNFYAASGQFHLDAINSDQLSDGRVYMSSSVTLPPNALLHFKHDWGFEDSDISSTAYDGGVVEYSTNNGSTWSDAGSLIVVNGYNGTISSCCSNPLGNRAAFTHEGHGYTASRLNLNSLAGQNVRFRFRIGTDSTFGAWGWDVDDVRIYTCGAVASFRVYLPVTLKN
jgi:Zn-dependent metalloprotease